MLLELLLQIGTAWLYYLGNHWWLLLMGIGLAVVTKVYLGEKMTQYLQSRSKYTLAGSIGVAAFTPLCACGTMAVIISMFVSTLPWGPVMAFLITSPLASPAQFAMQSGFLGMRLAIAGLTSALLMGAGAGLLATVLEKRTAFFAGQFRQQPKQQCGGSCSPAPAKPTCCAPKTPVYRRWRIDQVLVQLWELGIKRVLVLFLLFVALGQLVETLVPSQAILAVFNPGKADSVVWAALIGTPLYVSGTAGLPLLRSLLAMGASEGAVPSFLIAGNGTSIAVIAGLALFLRPKALALYVALIFTGAIVSGFVYNLVF